MRIWKWILAHRQTGQAVKAVKSEKDQCADGVSAEMLKTEENNRNFDASLQKHLEHIDYTSGLENKTDGELDKEGRPG